MKIYRYSGAGNSFVVIDGRNIDVRRYRTPAVVRALCSYNGTDGLMLLLQSKTADFRMEFYNPDGSGGMMCGNGGRCIVAFADLLGVKPFHTRDYVFEAPDGIHHAEILSHLGEMKLIRLEMRDVQACEPALDGWFADTGTRHFVKFVPDADAVDIETEGPAYRNHPAFAPAGANANFVSPLPDGSLRVRTFEKGVEGETPACGTGVTACAIAACASGVGKPPYTLIANGGTLSVDFVSLQDGTFTQVFLTGPTLCEGEL